MKNKSLMLASAVLMSLGLAVPTVAAHGLDPDTIVTGGDGCAVGSVVKKVEELSEGVLKVDLEFSEYNVLVGYGQPLARKACAVAIPISMGANQKLKVKKILLRADGIIAKNSKTSLKAEVFTSGEVHPTLMREIVPNQELQGRFILRGKDVLETECGVVTNLRVNSSILLNSQGTRLESGLSSPSMTLILVAEACH